MKAALSFDTKMTVEQLRNKYGSVLAVFHNGYIYLTRSGKEYGKLYNAFDDNGGTITEIGPNDKVFTSNMFSHLCESMANGMTKYEVKLNMDGGNKLATVKGWLNTYKYVGCLHQTNGKVGKRQLKLDGNYINSINNFGNEMCRGTEGGFRSLEKDYYDFVAFDDEYEFFRWFNA